MEDYKTSKRIEYHREILELYNSCDNTQDGAVNYHPVDVENAIEKTLSVLNADRNMTIRQNAFGFNYGDCSFTDLIVKPSELYLAENPKLNQPGSSIELFIYLCNYRSIYVMGTRPGVKEEFLILPGLNSVDFFTTKHESAFGSVLSSILKSCGWTRAYADELSTSLEGEINLNSNLTHKEVTVFDAYFNWID